MNLWGFRRPDGLFGIRNHLLILPTSVCATTVAANIAAQVPGAVAVANQHGCCQLGADYEQTLRTLIGIGRNPNVGAVLVVGLGCEGIPILHTAEEIAKSGKPVQSLIIQEHGGTIKTAALGVQIAAQMARNLSMLKREEAPFSELSLGVECGGSDFTSGLASNPAAGTASDLLVKAGGTAMLSETTEFIGAEHVLAKRAKSPEVAARLLEIVKETELRAQQLHVDLRDGQPTPGNIAGGISSIEEKSLGCIYKAGQSTIQDILAYGETPQGKGLYVMDTPGQDVESMIGMLAGGIQIIVFTTGRGTPTGSPIAPVIKVTANADTYLNMEDNIDLDLSSILTGTETIEDSGRRIFEEIIEVANGKLTKSESLGHQEFGIFRIGPTF